MMTTKTMTKAMVILLFVVFCSNCSLLQVVAIETVTPDDVAGIISTTTTGSGSATATTASSSSIEGTEQEIRNAASSSSSSSSSLKKRKKQWMNIGGPSYSSANTNIDAESNDNLEWILTDPSVNSFDVYSKVISTKYSQVHWTNHGTIPLPSDVIERYSTTYSSGNSTINKSSDTMAIVGYEVDQVMMIVDKGGQEKEVSVPITWAYNHHYMAYLMGEDDESESEDVVAAQAQRMIEHHHHPDHSLEHLNSNNNWIFISEGNGGEMRKSYHCYPNGYAQLIKRPTSFSITPMQIDTWNRNLMMNHTGVFVPPSNIEVDKYMLPKSSQIRDLHKSNYNPIMECPCSDRLKKRLEMTYILRDYLQHQGDVVVEDKDNDNGNDNDKQLLLDNSTECFNVAVQLIPSTNVTKRIIINNDTNNDEVVEGHCIATVHDDGSLVVVWNTSAASATSSSSAISTASVVVTKASKNEDRMGNSNSNSNINSNAYSNNDNNNYNTNEDTIIMVGTTPLGSIINVTIVLNITSQMVDITMKGPYIIDNKDEDEEETDNENLNENVANYSNDEVWFGIGLGADTMCIHMEADECTTGGPYTIIVLPARPPSKNTGIPNTRRGGGDNSKVVERKLDFHGPGKLLIHDDNDDNYGLIVLSNHIVYEDEEEVGTTAGHEAIGTLRSSYGRRHRKERSEEEIPQPKRRRRRRRVVNLQRPFQGPTNDYYSFHNDHKPLRIILATGCNSNFGQHCGHQSPTPIVFAEVNKKQEIVRNGIKGYIDSKPFDKQCLEEPYSDLIQQNNPTCNVGTYQGGLSCCVHNKFLLDTNQTIPWSNQPLEYRMKFRFYYQDYFPSSAAYSTSINADDEDDHDGNKETINDRNSNAVDAATSAATTDTSTDIRRRRRSNDNRPASHQDLIRFYWTTEAGSGEYDVPRCDSGTPISQCVHVITSHWKVKDFVDDHDQNGNAINGIKLIYAGPHCHAQACLSMELYNADTGKLLCHVEPIRGGGRNINNNNEGIEEQQNYNEEGFIAIPPCLWSEHNNNNSSSSSLSQPDFLSLNTTLMSLKRANSTFPHTGEMASWQMRGIVVV